MKHLKTLGVLASALVLSAGALPVVAADQYETGTTPGGPNPTGTYPSNQDAADTGMQRDNTQPQRMQNRDRRARNSREAGLVECKDSPKCRQKNTNWPDLQNATKPLLVDPATGMPPKK